MMITEYGEFDSSQMKFFMVKSLEFYSRDKESTFKELERKEVDPVKHSTFRQLPLGAWNELANALNQYSF